jgi:GWxTD domain-containing protein
MSAAHVLALAAIVLTAGSSFAQAPRSAQTYQKWLDEEVVYIITPLERDVFNKLQTDRERDLFIEAFWKHRNAGDTGKETSFRAEHYRRITYANRYYGRTSPLPGWRTDRGRMYILLGEPTSVTKYDTKADVYPTEVWFYQNKERLGLPAGFYLVFFQERGSGDYKLYSPAKDGPQALMTTYSGDITDYTRAYQSLREISPELAEVSMSLIPGESSAIMGRPTLSSDLLLKKVEDSPRRQVEETYARKFLEFKDIVDVEYSANYLDCDVLFKVLRDPGGLAFVHYAVEPSRLSVEQVGNKYVTALKINGNVSESGGRLIYQFDKTASISMTGEQVRDASRMKFDFHDMFPLIPGTYKVSILIKNEASKEFMSAEQTLLIAGEKPAIQMTSPILAYKTARAEEGRKRLKPFRLGAVQLYCQPNRAFARTETLAAGLQLWGLDAAQKEAGRIRYVFSRDGQAVRTKERALGEYAAFPGIIEEFALDEFVPAHYVLTVSVLLEGREVVTAKEEFDVSQQSVLPRPWFYSKILPDISDPVYDATIGGQLANVGRLSEARALLEKTWRAKPDSPDAALALARVLRAMNEEALIPAVLDPFLRPPVPPRYEIYALAAAARVKLGQAAAAAELYDRTIAQFGVNADLLNGAGEARAALGQTKEALAAWEQSLKINPNQPDVRKKIEDLKTKK